MQRPNILLLTCLCLTGIVSSTFAATPLRGTPCAAGTPQSGTIGETQMDADQLDLVACLYTDTAHSTPPNAGVWQSMIFGTLGPSSTNAAPSVAGDLTTGLFSPSPGQVAVSTGGVQRFVVDQFGNIGVGTKTPQEPFQLASQIAHSVIRLSSPASADSTIQFYNDDGQGNDVDGWAIGKGGIDHHRYGDFFINYDPSPGDGVYHILTIHFTGNRGDVAINSDTPQATLDVNGYMRLATNLSSPVACSPTNTGAIALTHRYTLCVCNGGSMQWVQAQDGLTACSW
jgi:hypothetical protein